MPRRSPTLDPALARLAGVLARQGGVCTRTQALEAGLSPEAVQRLVGSGRWTWLHAGVYHVGPGRPPFSARLWGAHLALGPASVISGRSAGHYWGLVDDPFGPIRALVPEHCTRRPRGVDTSRVPDPSTRAHPARVPPILSVEHTVCDLVAMSPDEAAAVDVVLRACRLRLTTPDRILAAAGSLPRLRHRRVLLGLCGEASDGVTSPLEREYRRRVARPHGLPAGRAQVGQRAHGRRAYRDLVHDGQAVIVELDGRLGHEQESEVLRDQFRDNAATLSGAATLRFGWLAVIGQSCEVAVQVVHLLSIRGWSGTGRPCSPGCPVGATEPLLA